LKERKLQIISHNKHLIKLLNINIIDFRRLSKRYIIFEKNGKVKIYNSSSDELIFEGEYLNGKKNGKGKEYYENGKLKYEGEYINGKKNGKGKEYYENGNIKYEGEYLNDEKNGIGIEYDEKDGYAIFKGHFKNDHVRIWNNI